MIITCNNCNKKFNVVSSVIPENGRLLQCSACNHKWFFKKEIINEPIMPIKIDKPAKQIVTNKDKADSVGVDSSKTIELLDRTNKNENNDKDLKIKSFKEKKNYNILNLIIIFIISFIALIIVLDTFQKPISKILPNIEFLLYNLYETINDIVLFFEDLI